MSAPCYFCEIRSDIGCRHQAADGPPPPAILNPKPRKDGRTGQISGGGHYRTHPVGAGLNFKRGPRRE